MFELSPTRYPTSWEDIPMAATPTRRRSTAPVKPAPEPEVIEDDEFEEIEEDDDSELEELADEDTEDETPAPKAKKTAKSGAKPAPAKAPEAPKYNTAWLATHITSTTGKNYDGRSVRMLLRKLAADGKLARKVGEDRDRYTFPEADKDPIVVQVIAMITSGEAAALKQAGLQAVKDKAAEKKAAAKLAKEQAAQDDEDAVEEIDDEEETPAPKARTAAKATPAKATPVRRTRTAAK